MCLCVSHVFLCVWVFCVCFLSVCFSVFFSVFLCLCVCFCVVDPFVCGIYVCVFVCVFCVCVGLTAWLQIVSKHILSQQMYHLPTGG